MAFDVVWLHYEIDHTLVSYAAAVAHRLKVPLYVTYAIPKTVSLSDERLAATHARIQEQVRTQNGVSSCQLEVRVGFEVETYADIPRNAVIISNYLPNHPALPVWRPAYETMIRNSDGPILVPLGNDPAYTDGYTKGVALAQVFSCEVVFYHTTWRNPAVESDDPYKHRHHGAVAVMDDAVIVAEAAGVRYRTLVETADGVVEGLHHIALREQATAMMVQEDSHVVAGSYVEHLIARPHLVPLIVLPEDKRRV